MLQLSEHILEAWALVGVAATGYVLLTFGHNILYFFRNGSFPKSEAELELKKTREQHDFETQALEQRAEKAELERHDAQEQLNELFERVMDRL